MAKGPNYRKRQFMNFWKNFFRGKQGSQFLLYKYDNKKQNRRWTISKLEGKNQRKQNVKEKIRLKRRVNQDLQNQYWMILTLKIYILTLEVHRRFDAVTIDKASNNFFLFVKNATWKDYCLKLAWTIILQLKKLLHRRSCKCHHHLM